MKNAIVAGILVIGLVGCSPGVTMKSLYQNNTQLLAGLVKDAAAQGCGQYADSFQPGEATPVCAAMTSCATALCPVAK